MPPVVLRQVFHHVRNGLEHIFQSIIIQPIIIQPALLGVGLSQPQRADQYLVVVGDDGVLTISVIFFIAGQHPNAIATAAIESDEASSVCVCYVENVSKARIDYAVRKLS